MKYGIKIKCSGCKGTTELAFRKKPNIFQPTVESLKCSECESELMVRLMKERGLTGKVTYLVEVTKPSPELIALLKEQSEAKK